jgi:hypothetical protein
MEAEVSAGEMVGRYRPQPDTRTLGGGIRPFKNGIGEYLGGQNWIGETLRAVVWRLQRKSAELPQHWNWDIALPSKKKIRMKGYECERLQKAGYSLPKARLRNAERYWVQDRSWPINPGGYRDCIRS